MSLYFTQKLIYNLNRDSSLQARFLENMEPVLAGYHLTDEELEMFRQQDIGRLYIHGVNGQLLMHYAALCGYAWPEYIQAMRDALDQYGNVRAGIYATTDGKGAV